MPACRRALGLVAKLAAARAHCRRDRATGVSSQPHWMPSSAMRARRLHDRRAASAARPAPPWCLADHCRQLRQRLVDLELHQRRRRRGRALQRAAPVDRDRPNGRAPVSASAIIAPLMPMPTTSDVRLDVARQLFRSGPPARDRRTRPGVPVLRSSLRRIGIVSVEAAFNAPERRRFRAQTQPDSSRRTIVSITAMPSALSLRQGMWAKFLPPACMEYLARPRVPISSSVSMQSDGKAGIDDGDRLHAFLAPASRPSCRCRAAAIPARRSATGRW